MSVVVGWFLIFLLSGVIGWIGWLQWNAYRTLDQKIEQLDPALISSAGTRVEKILDAPPGSVVVPYVMASVVPVQNAGFIPTPVVAPTTEDVPSTRLIEG
jgi:hypothetical protein